MGFKTRRDKKTNRKHVGCPFSGARLRSTYSLQKTLLFILLLGIKAVVNESVTSASATTVSSLETVDGDGLFLGLHLSAELSLDLLLGNVGHLGVDQIERDLRSSEE